MGGNISILTSIEHQKVEKRYNLYIDDQFALGIHEDTLLKYDLYRYVGKSLDDKLLQEVRLAEDKHKAFNYAVLLLSYRGRSAQEITKRMVDKGFSSDITEHTRNELIRLGYLDDIEFSKILIRDRQRVKKIGKNLIKQELWHKGISKEMIHELLEEVSDDQQEYERAKELASKKIHSYRNDDARAKQRKLFNFLVRKGYSYDTAAQVTREFIQEDFDE